MCIVRETIYECGCPKTRRLTHCDNFRLGIGECPPNSQAYRRLDRDQCPTCARKGMIFSKGKRNC